MAKALLFLGGEFKEEALVRKLAPSSSIIVCADSGAEHLRRLDIQPHAIVGDLDSISAETLRFYEGLGSSIIRVSEQEHNDFEKSLKWLEPSHRGEVHVFGMTGGRTDHILSNLSVMLRYATKFARLLAHDQWGEHEFVLPGRAYSLEREIGTTVSLTPFGSAEGVVTTNLKYPLNEESLKLGVREGLSNVVMGSPVSVSLTSGAMLISVAATSH